MTNPNVITSEVLNDLQTAMMLLEMHGTEMFSDEDANSGLVVGAHAIIQHVCQTIQGRPQTQGELIAETLAIVWARVAIADAKKPPFNE